MDFIGQGIDKLLQISEDSDVTSKDCDWTKVGLSDDFKFEFA